MTGEPAATLSPLPRSLDPLPDESLPGYRLRLAHRLGLAPARVMQVTGLADSREPARRSLMMRLDEARADAFCRITRLTAAEASQLSMSSMSGRYPWAAPQATADQWGPRALASPWVFTSATRYCPQCLAGDGSPIQLQHRLLEHVCPSCRQPALSAGPGAPALLIPHASDGGDLKALSELLAPARDGASRKTPRGRWIRRYHRAGHDCSAGFQNALEPLITSFQRSDRRSRGRRAPARRPGSLPSTSPSTCKTTGTASTSATSAGTPGCSAAPPPSAWSRSPQAARSPRLPPSLASTTATSRHPPGRQPSPTTRQSSASRCTPSPGSSAPPPA